MYYKFCAVSVFEEMDVLNVVLTFPVTSYGLRYQKYGIVNFPIYWSEINKFVSWTMHKFNFFNFNHMDYFLSDGLTDLKCIQYGTVEICQVNSVKSDVSVESCEYSTFSENDTSLCHKHVLFSDVPFLMRLGSFVVFSVKLESTVFVMFNGLLKVVNIKESGI